MPQVSLNRMTSDMDLDHDVDVVTSVLAASTPTPDQLLPVLHAIQTRVGHVSKGAMRLVAQAFNISRADVYGVVTFYEDFREEPVGRHVVQLCMAEACQSVGCRELAAHAEHSLGVAMGETTADGAVHLESVFCLGNCALGPSMRVDHRIVGRMTSDRFDTLISVLRMTDAPKVPTGATGATV